MRRKEMVGDRYNRLVVSSYLETRLIGKNQSPVRYWLCICDCGAETQVSGRNLRSGQVKSCGCLRADVSRASMPMLDHGHASNRGASPTYRSWRAMMTRCKLNLHYVERGITVCERWKDFRNFLADMGDRPEGHSIDRYPDRNGGYEPHNCRWATAKQQANNRARA